MQQSEDETKWNQLYLDTPLGVDPARSAEAGRRRDPDLLLDCPGVHLKSRNWSAPREEQFARFAGEKDGVYYVISKPDALNGHAKIVWSGTFDEYRAMWRVD